MSTTTGGLEDVVATTSHICDLDGKLGKLTYYGVDIHDLARFSTFEETAYLLWHGVLPTRSQLSAIMSEMQANRELPQEIIDLMHSFPKTTAPMDVLRTAVSMLSLYDPSARDNSLQANERRKRITIRCLAQ